MSSTANMPIAMPKSVSARSTCSGVAPSSTRNCVSYMYGNIIRLPDEAGPVADDDPDLAEALREGQRRHQHVEAGARSAHDFEQPHDVRRAEEMQADHRLGTRRGAGDPVDVERRGVGREDAARLGDRVDLAEDALLEREILEDGFDHQIRVRGARAKGCRRRQVDARQPLADGVGRETTARRPTRRSCGGWPLPRRSRASPVASFRRTSRPALAQAIAIRRPSCRRRRSRPADVGRASGALASRPASSPRRVRRRRRGCSALACSATARTRGRARARAGSRRRTAAWWRPRWRRRPSAARPGACDLRGLRAGGREQRRVGLGVPSRSRRSLVFGCARRARASRRANADRRRGQIAVEIGVEDPGRPARRPRRTGRPSRTCRAPSPRRRVAAAAACPRRPE